MCCSAIFGAESMCVQTHTHITVSATSVLEQKPDILLQNKEACVSRSSITFHRSIPVHSLRFRSPVRFLSTAFLLGIRYVSSILRHANMQPVRAGCYHGTTCLAASKACQRSQHPPASRPFKHRCVTFPNTGRPAGGGGGEPRATPKAQATCFPLPLLCTS